MHYLFLTIAIIGEVVATTALKASEELTRVGPSILVGVGYLVAFYFLILSIRVIPVGIAYAMWSGIGIVLIGVTSAILFKQIPDWPAVLGMLLIVAGVMTIHLFSKTTGTH
ncbi:MAG: DMT family transporter [Pseudomonadales bacterium]